MIAFAVAYRTSDRFRALTLAIDLRLVTAMQAWRVIGGVFLVLYAYGLLPGLFAWPAGAGDMIVGISAVFVLYAMIVDAPGWRRRLWWLNAAGIADFIVAIGTGVLTSNTAIGILSTGAPRIDLGALPLSLIPTFLVPAWTILHMIAFLQLRRGSAARGAVVRAAAA